MLQPNRESKTPNESTRHPTLFELEKTSAPARQPITLKSQGRHPREEAKKEELRKLLFGPDRLE